MITIFILVLYQTIIRVITIQTINNAITIFITVLTKVITISVPVFCSLGNMVLGHALAVDVVEETW